jgi:xylose dehydrogenase (NAD/NADP)
MSILNEPLRIGILGCAKIAREFCSGVKASPLISVQAVASRELSKAQDFAREFDIFRAYGSYEELLADPQIEAVYNPLPNSLHAPWSIRAMQSGKHVLCEKPLGASPAEVRAMFAAADANGVQLVEGIPYRSQPHAAKLMELIAAGAIGRVQLMHAAFSFTLSDPANIRLRPDLAGGALADVGIYPVSLVRMVAGERPVRVCASAKWHPSGVDETLVGTLEHASGMMAQISCSFTAAIHRQALIAGTGGLLETYYMNTPTPAQPAALRLKRGVTRDAVAETVEVVALNGFMAEAESFARLVRLGPGHWNGVTRVESLDIAITMDALLQSARLGAPVMVSTASNPN